MDFSTKKNATDSNTYGITAASAISGWERSMHSNSAGGICKIRWARHEAPINVKSEDWYRLYYFCIVETMT